MKLPYANIAQDDYKYAAFISYCHLPRDTEVAVRIQKAIETYTLPRDVAASLGVKRKLGKCFRDEDELAASHSLPDRIIDALRQSSALVVICTPNTKDSDWVQREVAAYIEMHGRERVFAVLADGSSTESIPDALGTISAGGSGEGGGIRSNPLAADLRPEASGKAKDEILRLIAGIAQCDYDDLRRRGLARKRKKAAAASTVAVIVVAVVVAALVAANDSRINAQIEESHRLAAESSELLARGDRYGAIECALEALPQSEASDDRPYVSEARDALENALGLGSGMGSAWEANFEIKTEAPLGLLGNSLTHETDDENPLASSLVVSDEGGYFAVSDNDGNIAVFDTLTGKKLADCEMPIESGPLSGGLYACAMAATRDYLIVADGGDSGAIAYFDARTGAPIWSQRGAGAPSFDTSYGENYISMSAAMKTGGYEVAIADLESGVTSGTKVEDVGSLNPSSGYFNVAGARLGTNYSAFGNRLFEVELDSGDVKEAHLAYEQVTSLAYEGNTVYVASASPMPTDSVSRRFAIEAFNEDLELVWRYEGTFASEMMMTDSVTTLLTGEPVVCGMTGDGRGVVMSVGRQAFVLEASDGSMVTHVDFDQTVVDAQPMGGSEGDPGFIVIASASGVVTCKDLLEGAHDLEGDSRRLALTFPIRWAHATHCGEYDVLLAVPADTTDKIVSFKTDWVRAGQTPEDYPLDELLALAHDTLDKGGRDYS